MYFMYIRVRVALAAEFNADLYCEALNCDGQWPALGDAVICLKNGSLEALLDAG